jgi:hypothetical protein
MQGWEQFLLAMGALSTASQKLTDHVIKGRFVNELGTPNNDPVLESRRQTWIHLIAGLFGVLLCVAAKIDPIEALKGNSIAAGGLDDQLVIHYVMAGVLVSFGGSFFNDLLGLVREFKSTQAELKKTFAAQTAGTQPPGTVIPSASPALIAPAPPIPAVPAVAPEGEAAPAAVAAGGADGVGAGPAELALAALAEEPEFRDPDAEGFDISCFDREVA